MLPSSSSITSSETVTVLDGAFPRSEPHDDPPPAPGTELSRYVVLGPLGRGGMGEVLRAYDPRLHREVALKRLRSGVLEEGAAERLVREAQAMAQLSHPNVVAVYDVERLESTVLLAMELVPGQTLGRYIRTRSPSWQEILQVFVQAGRGLAAAHAADLVHRDFKPENVLVGDDGRVRVTDFGLARPVGDRPFSEGAPAAASISGSHASLASTVTQAGMVMGTPVYMAPEQHLGREASAKADQYAFCVSLWEALVGRRPFVGDYQQVAAAKIHGPPEWPTGSAVPRRVVEAINRGLAIKPAERWPSMEALLAVLDRDPARVRLRLITGAALTVATLATAGAVAGWWSRAPPVCEGAAEHLEGIWDDAQRDRVAQSMRATGVEYAEPTISEVTRRLDEHADAWVLAHTEACEATSIRAEQSAAVLDLRMGCLRRRLHSLGATVELLSEADATVMEDAIPMVAGLPSPAACADIDALQAAVPPPEDPSVAEAVDRARRELARAKASASVGREDEARSILDAIPPTARSYGPLAAELDLTRGMVALDGRRYDEAEPSFDEAYLLALRSGDHRTAVEAMAALAFTVGVRRMREAEAMLLIRTAEALAEDIGSPELHAVVLNDMGGILQANAHHADAIERFEQALAIQRELLGEGHPSTTATMTNIALSLQEAGDYPRSLEIRHRVLELERGYLGDEHPRIARLLHIIGNSLHQRGDYEASVEHLERALQMRRKLLGPQHPETAHTMASLGLAQSALGRHAEAERNIREAFEILEREVGIEHYEVIDTLTNLAIVVDAQGRFEEALALHQRTADALERVMGPEHPRTAVALSNTAGELVSLRRYEEALPLVERAIAILRETSGPEHPHLAVFEGNAGNILLGLGRLPQAEERFRRALPVMEAAFGPEHVYVSYGLVGLGRTLLAQGRREEALPLLRRAVELQRQDGVSDSDRAEARFALAQTLLPDDPPRAVELATEAKTLLQGAGPGHARDLADVDAWLAANGRR
ncbi:MAG: serine/threonine protein kinase [Myxococcales bacterium]|nr:serine/threonine protein kinase [Myxococcales bacterium]